MEAELFVCSFFCQMLPLWYDESYQVLRITMQRQTRNTLVFFHPRIIKKLLCSRPNRVVKKFSCSLKYWSVFLSLRVSLIFLSQSHEVPWNQKHFESNRGPVIGIYSWRGHHCTLWKMQLMHWQYWKKMTNLHWWPFHRVSKIQFFYHRLGWNYFQLTDLMIWLRNIHKDRNKLKLLLSLGKWFLYNDGRIDRWVLSHWLWWRPLPNVRRQLKPRHSKIISFLILKYSKFQIISELNNNKFSTFRWGWLIEITIGRTWVNYVECVGRCGSW